MKHWILLIGLFSLGLLVLTACAAPATPETPTSAPAGQTPPVQKTEAPAPVEKTLYVGPELVDCTGVAPMKCMQVKENPGDAYTNFFDPIAGFSYEPGFEYVLKVSVEPVANPPADASKFQYTLVEQVSKTPVGTATPSAQTSSLEGQTWKLDWYLDSQGQQMNVLAGTEITAEFKDGNLAGNAGLQQLFWDLPGRWQYAEGQWDRFDHDGLFGNRRHGAGTGLPGSLGPIRNLPGAGRLSADR